MKLHSRCAKKEVIGDSTNSLGTSHLNRIGGRGLSYRLSADRVLFYSNLNLCTGHSCRPFSSIAYTRIKFSFVRALWEMLYTYFHRKNYTGVSAEPVALYSCEICLNASTDSWADRCRSAILESMLIISCAQGYWNGCDKSLCEFGMPSIQELTRQNNPVCEVGAEQMQENRWNR